MTEHPENPLQDIIQERVKRNRAIGVLMRLAAVRDSMGLLAIPLP